MMQVLRCKHCGDLLTPIGDVGDLLTIFEAEDGTTDCVNHLHEDGQPLPHEPEDY